MREFVNHVSETAAECLANYKGGEMHITGYNPPWSGTPTVGEIEMIPGHFVLDFVRSSGEKRDYAALYIIFSCLDKNNENFKRDGLDETDKKWLREDDTSGVTIYAYNFDEAWQITCKIGEILAISRLSISCGGA